MNTFHTRDITVWLKDAHALEEHAEQLFSTQSNRLRNYGTFPQLLKSEAEKSKRHREMLAVRIQQLGGQVSFIKDTGAKLLAAGQNILGFVMDDEPVKGVITLYTVTQLAIASYTVLITAAELALDEETARISEEILHHHRSRSTWLETQLQQVTQLYLTRSAA